MHTDSRGLALTAAGDDAVARYNTTIDHLFEYRLDTGKCLKAALAADPEMPMAQCLRGYLFMMFNTNQVYDRVDDALTAARALSDRMNPREALHLAALEAWRSGDVAQAVLVWEQLLAEYPLDLLALRLQHNTVFWMGRSQALRGRIAQVLPAWDESVPGYGYVLGMFAFGLEECGEYASAEAQGRRAVEIHAEDLWAVHAVAHVLEMQGRLDDGMAWLDQPADQWADRNPFRGHLWWHTALFPFEKGDYERVLALYDNAIRTEKTDFYLDIQNAAALLLRLEFQDVDVGARWLELAEHAEAHSDDHVLAFTDLHHMISLVRAGKRAAAEALLESLANFAATPGNFTATTMEPATIPLCKTILAYGDGNYDGAIEILRDLRYEDACVGGSHAQRDLFAQLLIECALKASRLPLARALLAERVALRPHSHGNWTKYAGVLAKLGDTAGAEAAEARASAV